MKTLYDINKHIDRLVQLKNKAIFELGHYPDEIYEIEDNIILLYDAKNIIQNNKVDKAIQIIEDKRKRVIKKKKKLANRTDLNIYARWYNNLFNCLQEEIRFFNWILGREEFDEND